MPGGKEIPDIGLFDTVACAEVIVEEVRLRIANFPSRVNEKLFNCSFFINRKETPTWMIMLRN